MQAMTKQRHMDMLNGPLWSKLPRYALPVAATGILGQLFNAADVAVVGNFTGELRTVAVAAVGANSPVIGLLLNLFIGIALGANVVIANAIGRGDRETVHRAVHTSIVTALVGGVLVALFGQLRNAKRAAKAQIASSEWALRGVRLALAAEVATTYFTLLEYERDMAIARQSCALRRESAALIDSMFRYGMSDGVALEQARSLVYTAEADIPQYRRAVAQTRLSLDILLGETPRRTDSAGAGLRLLTDYRPADIPVGLPSELLERRPDIMQARYDMLAAAAEVGIARGNRFPSIALTTKGGIASNSIKGLTSANPWAWDALGSLTLPVFNFGRLRRAEQAAMERYTQSALTYEQTVLTAFSDVEQALVAIATYRRQTERYGELVLANDRIAAMTQALYRSGLSDYLDVIDAQRSLYQSQMEFVNLVAQQYINYVNLCKALGGGW